MTLMNEVWRLVGGWVEDSKHLDSVVSLVAHIHEPISVDGDPYWVAELPRPTPTASKTPHIHTVPGEHRHPVVGVLCHVEVTTLAHTHAGRPLQGSRPVARGAE